MITRNTLFLNAVIAFLLSFPQLSHANDFTSMDVLEWTEKQQDSFFQVSVTMLAIVAARTGNHNDIAECIDGWFGGGDESQPQRSARIREVMAGLPDYHPQAVILAVIEKECGEFKR